MLECIAHPVGDEPGGDGHNGLPGLQAVLQQGLAGLYDVHNHVAEAKNGGDLNGPAAGVRYFWVKPSDVAIYVERGAADVGVAGKDILLEYGPQVYELADLGLGHCRMCVAAPRDFRDRPDRVLRVATKFPRIAARYYFKDQLPVLLLNGGAGIPGGLEPGVDLLAQAALGEGTGKDIILEYEPEVYELADLGLGKCRMCVAAKKDLISLS